MSDAADEIRINDEWGAIDPAFVTRLVEALDAQEPKPIRALTRDLHAADLADVLCTRWHLSRRKRRPFELLRTVA